MHAAFSTIQEDYIQMPPHRSDHINSDLSILSCGGCLALGIIITIPHLSYLLALPHLENCSNTAYVLTDWLYFCLFIYLPFYLLHKLAYYSTIIELLLAAPTYILIAIYIQLSSCHALVCVADRITQSQLLFTSLICKTSYSLPHLCQPLFEQRQ